MNTKEHIMMEELRTLYFFTLTL